MFLSWSLTLSMNRPLAQQKLVGEAHNPLAHMLAYFGHQPDALGREELLSERLRGASHDRRRVCQTGGGRVVARGGGRVAAWRQAESQQFATIIDDQV